MKVTWQTWRLAPRDPLVFGRGGATPAYLPSLPGWMPPQTAAAGLVRSTLAGGGTAVSAQEAKELLEVAIRGPWLLERRDGGDRIWVPLPADCLLVGHGGDSPFVRTELRTPRNGEGFSQPTTGPTLPALLSFPPKSLQGLKTRRPELPYRPLDWVVQWSLGEEASAVEPDPVVRREARVHVGIDDDSLTAEPEALFGSVGLRFGESFELAVEVHDGRGSATKGRPSMPPLLILGGEARACFASVVDGEAFADFEVWRGAIEERITALDSRRSEGSCELGLRLQLLTPGAFGGWRPAEWPASLAALPLVAATVTGFEAISGWDLQRRRPREVRRLVPAGSVYTFGPVRSGTALLDLCRSLWGRSLCEGMARETERSLAAPANDGYGTVLAVPCALPKEDSSR